ncbi:MAG TPA: AsmA family protein [Burkholderiales bacterium]|nr:AsmA family protein [Burkholderiales bacterium]
MPFRFPKFRRTTGVLLGLLVVFAVVVALFDWNWLRHPLERYLVDRSGREVRIGDLHVDLGFEPTVRVRDVYIENAPWADKRPTAVAGEATFTFSLKSVWERRPVISRLVLIDADVDMERQADGLRNWRLRNPEDRGPGRIKVLRLEPHRTTIRFVRRDVDLEVTATASSSEAGSEGLKPDAAHPTQISFKGEFGGTAFSGEVLTSELLTFLETGESFPLRGHISAGKNKLDADGTIADLFEPSAIDAKVRLAGSSLSKLGAFFRTSLPASRPYDFRSHFRLVKDDASFTDVEGKLGDTDIAGVISVDRSKERLMLRAALRSESTHLSDFGSLVSSGQSKEKAGTPHDENQNAGPENPEPGAGKRLFPNRAFKFERLRSFDAHVTLDLKKLKAAELQALDSVRVTADLNDGVLALKPLDIGLAGGHVLGLVMLDGQQKPLSAHAKMELKDVRLEKLLERLRKGARSAGPLKGHVDLKGRGDSIAKLLASATGSMEITMEGGGISNLLDAKLGLNGGKILRLLMTGDHAIGINTAEGAFDFDKGLGTSTAIVLDTDQTHTEGTGTIDLRHETVDVVLTPHPKKPRIFSLASSIRVHGPFRQPRYSLVKKTRQKD